MAAPPIPSDEVERLKTLHSYDMLDVAPDPEFDDIVRLAAVVCEAPISLVTFIDVDRQVFRARFGVRATSTPRNISFCAHVLTDRELFVVRDAREDDRFKDNPDVVGGLKIRFYAGMPILSPKNVALGTLCVVDHVPRDLTAPQLESLRILGRVVQTHIKRRIDTIDDMGMPPTLLTTLKHALLSRSA